MDEYLEEVKKASGVIWKFFKEFIGIKQNEDKRWEICIKTAEELSKSYVGTKVEKYAKGYIFVALDEIERVSKIGKDG
jgi:hypothetical protein